MRVYELKENYHIILPLIQALDRYLAGLYPPESNHLLSMEELLEPNVSIVVAENSFDNSLVGCGALVINEGFCEIKRMFVLPSARGKGAGFMLLRSLENIALEKGFEKVYLETGIHQPEAAGLYEKAGYKRTEAFGSYSPDPLSVFMVKELMNPPN